MRTFLRTHFLIITALLATLLAWYGLFSRQSFDGDWMLRWNHVDTGQVQFVYLVLAAALVLALPFAPRIPAALRRGRGIIIGLAIITSFLSVGLLEPDQQHRLFVTPFSIWIMIIHIVGLSILAVGYATWDRLTVTELPPWAHKVLIYSLLAGAVLVAILYVVARADFLPLDMPDEPYNASIATNYAQTNDLSSQYIGSAYGSPDVVFPRYYWVMGIWLKAVGSTSLEALRAFPVLVSAVSLGVFLVALWRLRKSFDLKPVQLLIAAIVLLSISTFMRTAHDLRMDILLALYSSLMLWGMLGFWDTRGQTTRAGKSRYLILMGAALFFGMEAIPLAAVPVSVATGIMLIVWWLRQPHRKSTAHYIVIYAVVCTLGIGLYYLFQFLPDVADSWARYQGFVQSYTGMTGVGTVRLPLNALVNIGRFSLILSPTELVLTGVAVVALWRMKVSAERWMLASVGLGLVLLLVLFRLSYSYMVVFAPFMAYAVARVSYPWQRIKSPLLLCFTAALIAVPVFDLTGAVQTRPNQTYLETLDVLTPQFPPGTVMVGEDAFWFILHQNRSYIGIKGIGNYMSVTGQDPLTALKTLKVVALLCDSGTADCQSLISTGYFGAPTTYQVGSSTYNIYWRANP